MLEKLKFDFCCRIQGKKPDYLVYLRFIYTNTEVAKHVELCFNYYCLYFISFKLNKSNKIIIGFKFVFPVFQVQKKNQ